MAMEMSLDLGSGEASLARDGFQNAWSPSATRCNKAVLSSSWSLVNGGAPEDLGRGRMAGRCPWCRGALHRPS